MNEDIDKCLVCDKEQEVLIQVIVSEDFIFAMRRGVCQECLKTKDINKVCKEFEVRKVKEKIKDMEESLKSFNENLKRLE